MIKENTTAIDALLIILFPTNLVQHDILKIGFQHLPPWLLPGRFQILDGS